MTGIHPSVASHKHNVLPLARPIRHKVRCFHPNRQKIIWDKIDKLLEAGFIREVEYPDWLANVIVVPKKVALFGYMDWFVLTVSIIKAEVCQYVKISTVILHIVTHNV